MQHQHSGTNREKPTLTLSQGAPVYDTANSETLGPKGPVLLQDVQFIEKMAHFDRERIPERVVHAKGSGAFGVFVPRSARVRGKVLYFRRKL